MHLLHPARLCKPRPGVYSAFVYPPPGIRTPGQPYIYTLWKRITEGADW